MKNIYLCLHVCFWAFMGAFRLFHECLKGTSRLYQDCFNVNLQYLKGVPGVFLRPFCPIEFVWVAAMASVCKVNLFLTKKHPKTHLKHDAYTFESFWKHS